MLYLRNILRSKARNLITVLGIAGGIGVFVAIASSTMDLNKQVSRFVSAYDTDIVIQEKKAPSPFYSKITVQDAAALENMFDGAAWPIVAGSLREKWNPYAIVVGVPHPMLRRLPLAIGDIYQPGESSVLLGVHAAGRLGFSPGDSISLGQKDHQISGIFRTGSRIVDGAIVTGLSEAFALFGRNHENLHYNVILVHTGSPEKTRQAILEVEKRFPHLNATPSVEFGGAIRIFQVIHFLSLIITGFALIGVCLVVINTLLMGISERTREIGILMSIGWSPWMVLRMLFLETICLCVAGALLGNLFGFGLLQAVNSFRMVSFGWIPLALDIQVLLLSVIVAVCVAFVSLIWPAVIVLRMQPAKAIMHE